VEVPAGLQAFRRADMHTGLNSKPPGA